MTGITVGTSNVRLEKPVFHHHPLPHSGTGRTFPLSRQGLPLWSWGRPGKAWERKKGTCCCLFCVGLLSSWRQFNRKEKGATWPSKFCENVSLLFVRLRGWGGDWQWSLQELFPRPSLSQGEARCVALLSQIGIHNLFATSERFFVLGEALLRVLHDANISPLWSMTYLQYCFCCFTA